MFLKHMASHERSLQCPHGKFGMKFRFDMKILAILSLDLLLSVAKI